MNGFPPSFPVFVRHTENAHSGTAANQEMGPRVCDLAVGVVGGGGSSPSNVMIEGLLGRLRRV